MKLTHQDASPQFPVNLLSKFRAYCTKIIPKTKMGKPKIKSKLLVDKYEMGQEKIQLF